MTSTDWRWRLEKEIQEKIAAEMQDMVSSGGEMAAKEYRYKSGFVAGLQWVQGTMQELDRRKE